LTRRAGEHADAGRALGSRTRRRIFHRDGGQACARTEITHCTCATAGRLAGRLQIARTSSASIPTIIVQPILMKKEEWKDDSSRSPKRTRPSIRPRLLWARSKNEISDEQYQEFYKHVGHDYDNPLAWTHARVEGRQEYTQLLYIPAHAPFDMWIAKSRHASSCMCGACSSWTTPSS